jgi:hypothetical protein
MLTLKWLIGLICFLYPTPVEGRKAQDLVHADQKTCGTSQALTNRHAT